jgi:hypothetical protein
MNMAKKESTPQEAPKNWVLLPVSTLKRNPNNPRVIKDAKFDQLVKSIEQFPEMMELRPIVVNEDMVVLGGNMRLAAVKQLKLKEVPVIIASNLTEDQQREFIIKDNVGYGEWDWPILEADWDLGQLADWGLEKTEWPISTQDFSDKNQEVDTSEFSGDMVISLKYTEAEYHIVREKLSKIAATPEQAVWILLGNE